MQVALMATHKNIVDHTHVICETCRLTTADKTHRGRRYVGSWDGKNMHCAQRYRRQLLSAPGHSPHTLGREQTGIQLNRS